MYTNRVQVFHGADGDAVVSGVADNFEFDFFPAGNAAFNQALTDRAVTRPFCTISIKVSSSSAIPPPVPPKSISRAYNQRITDFFTKLAKFASTVSTIVDSGIGWLIFFHGFFEQLAVFTTFDCRNLSTKKTYVVFFQNAFFF